MPVEKAVDMILKATFMRRHEVIVGNPGYWFITRLAFMSSIFNSIACDVKYKSQLRVIKKAKQN